MVRYHKFKKKKKNKNKKNIWTALYLYFMSVALARTQSWNAYMHELSFKSDADTCRTLYVSLT